VSRLPGHLPLGSTDDAALEDAMTLPTIEQARSWRGLTLIATDDEPVGKIEAIYVDRSTRQPEWALVNTGLFGTSRTFVPLADAAQRGDTVQVPHQTSVVREAPRLEQGAELSEEDEARLYAHYGIAYTTEESSSGLPAGETTEGEGATGPATATTELPPSTRLEADAPAADGLSAAAGSTRAARTATRKAVQAGQQAATSGRMGVHKARQEVAAVVDAIETTPESKRKARKRARARKRAMAAAAGAVRSVAAALAAAWRRARKSDAG
jgi:PRC-barrel domain